ncbi:MAG: class I SAM-dependent methyltransferase [Proteobacteria bacterium]|nr:class I SAM-dependent methyltransferase [Pseudomonadota bacterium]
MTDRSERVAEALKYRTMWRCEDYRRVSPGLVALDRLGLVDWLRRLGVQSVLDAGCGSGKVMRRLIEHHPGEFDVHGFDIAANCLDPWFDPIRERVLSVGCLWRREDIKWSFDAILCTDVLEHIPTRHVPAVLANLRAAARRFVFLGIALFDDRFGPATLGQPLHLTVRPPDWWVGEIRRAGLAILQTVTAEDAEGRPMWLYAMAAPGDPVPSPPSAKSSG